jgi:hypothetical protein
MEDDFDLADFLYSEIGLEDPRIRRVNLFKKLVRLKAMHGLPVVRIIANCWDDACNLCDRSTPARMFCSIVKRRLMEAKLWHEERKFDVMTIGEILKSGVFNRRAPMPLFPQEGPEKPPPRPGHHRNCQSQTCFGCG